MRSHRDAHQIKNWGLKKVKKGVGRFGSERILRLDFFVNVREYRTRKCVSGKARDARTVNAVPPAPALYATSKMLFGVLLACLYERQPNLSLCVVDGGMRADLCWLANFCTNHLPLVRFVFLDGIEESLTLFEHQQLICDALPGRRTSSSANSA